ncbi:MAG TPA: FecR domain-containing protein [Candidatus Dormibacteraeota bacterium]
MVARALRVAVLVSLVVLVISVTASSAALVLGPVATVRTGSVVFSLFTGGATLVRGGVARAGHSGDRLGDGDTVMTGADSKAGLLYQDGSVTRLDSDTTVTVHVATSAAGTAFEQSTGLTWNRVQQLVGSRRFTITGPNSTAAEVRGTEFGYYVEHDPAGNPVIWVDVWSGLVQVTGATGPPVVGGTGQRVTVRLGEAPTKPVAIPAPDRQLSFTVFNQALNAVSGTPVAFADGSLSQGGAAAPGSVRADGRSDLDFVLAWPGSTYRLTVRDPSGAVLAAPTSAVPPLEVRVPAARAGTWSFLVEDLASAQQEAWWVVVGRTPH